MRAAKVENGIVAAVWVVDALDCFEGVTLIQAPDGVGVGDKFDGKVFTPPPASVPREVVRAERNARLALCDWTQLPDADLTTAERAAWKAYRKALRDITNAPGFPDAVEWPSAPA